MRKTALTALILITAVLGSSCKKTTDATPATIPCDPLMSYSNQVHALFVANCTASNCHDGNSMASLSDYATARDAAAQIKNSVSNNRMPKGSTLSTSDKAAIICWIDNGAKNN
jgi:hypothetical protein